MSKQHGIYENKKLRTKSGPTRGAEAAKVLRELAKEVKARLVYVSGSASIIVQQLIAAKIKEVTGKGRTPK